MGAATISTETAEVVAPTASRTEPRTPLLLAAYTALALWLAFRHLGRFDTAIVGNSGDAFLNFWIVRDVQLALPHGWHALWNAPIFHPTSDTLAYSESLFVVALVDWPLRLAIGSVAAYNLVYVASWVVCGWATYRLASRWTEYWGAAFVASLLFTYSAARLSEFGHFQLIVGGALVPLTLLALLRCIDRPSPARGATVGVAFAVLMLTATYYGVMTAVLAAVTLIVWFAVRRPRDWRRYAGAGGVAGAVGAAVYGPFAYQYFLLQRHRAFRRTITRSMTLHVRDVLTAPSRTVATRVPVVGKHLAPTGLHHLLFPGFLALGAGAIGVIVIVRGLRDDPTDAGTQLVALITGAIVDLVLAAGVAVNVLGHRVPLPFAFLVRHVPGFTGIRAVFRFELAGQLVLAVLAGVGIDAVLRHRAAITRRATVAVMIAGVTLGATTAVRLVHIPTEADGGGVTRALEHAPAGAVLELPIRSDASGGAKWAYVEAPRELVALYDGHPRVNGYSGYEPPGFDHVAKTLNTFPSPAALRAARRLQVRYVVLRTRFFGGSPRSLERSLRGYARMSNGHAAGIVRRLPPHAAVDVDRVDGGYVIELQQRVA